MNKLTVRARDAGITAIVVLVMWRLVVSPLMVGGYPIADNLDFNLPWIASFADQLAKGDLYPRWLTDYAGGLGAPVFYFYGPAPFYLAAATDAACIGCDAQASLVVVHLLFYSLPAATFFAWARSFGGVRLSLLIAGLYVTMPYHLVDMERRGSLGESAAYVFMPLVLLGLRRAISARTFPFMGVFAYAALAYSHLPTAVLFTPVLCVYAALLIKKKSALHALSALSSIGIFGALLASAYILPAVALRQLLVPDGWVTAAGAHYAPESWLYFSPTALDPIVEQSRLALSITFSFATLVAAVAIIILILFRIFSGAKDRIFAAESENHARAAAISLAFCWLMMTDWARWFYVHIDVLRQVQFPWRIGSVIDLMSATIAAIAVARILELLNSLKSPIAEVVASASCLAAVAATVFGLCLIGSGIVAVERTSDAFKYVESRTISFRDPSSKMLMKQLFAEYPVEYRSKWVITSRLYVEGLATAEADPHFAAYKYWRDSVFSKPFYRVEGDDNGALSVIRTGPTQFDVTAELESPATIRLRQVYFPNWRLYDATTGVRLVLSASEMDGLISFDLPQGRHKLTLKSEALPVEIIGAAISAVTLLAIALAAMGQRRVEIRVTCPIFRPGKASRLP